MRKKLRPFSRIQRYSAVRPSASVYRSAVTAAQVMPLMIIHISVCPIRAHSSSDSAITAPLSSSKPPCALKYAAALRPKVRWNSTFGSYQKMVQSRASPVAPMMPATPKKCPSRMDSRMLTSAVINITYFICRKSPSVSRYIHTGATMVLR